MFIGNLASTNYSSSAGLAKHKESKAAGDVSTIKQAGFGHGDAYAAAKDGGKAKDLAEIKSRISAGFYDSSEVNDDLTELFSNIFKKAIPQ